MSHAGLATSNPFRIGRFPLCSVLRAKNDEINYDDDFRSGCEMVGSTCGLFENSPFWIIGHM